MRRLSLTTMTLLALSLGILTGIFLGEPASILKPIGDAFIRLLQMAVLPYFVVALIYGFGRLSYDEAKSMGIKAVGLLALLWGLCFIVIVSMPFAFPELESASFFSTSIVQPKKEIDFLELYIPANPFHSLSSAIIPAIVLFGISVGIALIGVKEKDNLLQILSTLSQALTRITQFVIQLTPIGVFSLAASAAGTMTIDEFARLQVYLVTYAVGALLLAFWLVPMLISALTPFTYREVLKACKDPLVTGFTTANLLIILPLLAQNCKELFKQKGLGGKHADSIVDVVVPVSFTFPDIGTLFILLFIPFAAWFNGNVLTLAQYPAFLVVGFFSFFGNVEIGMPFLLKTLEIPSDMFQLYVMTLVYIGRFSTLVAVMHITAIALMTTCAVNGWISFQWKRTVKYAGLSSALILIIVSATGAGLAALVDPEYKGHQTFMGLKPIFPTVSAKVHKDSLPPALVPEPDTSRLAQIRKRGYLRVGYFKDALPFAFINTKGELVGFDVEMAHILGRELGVSLEFVLIERKEIAERLNEGHCDIVMSGVLATPERAAKMTFATSYLDQTWALIVRDYRRSEFNSVEKVMDMEAPRLGVIDLPYIVDTLLRNNVPHAELVRLDSPRDFFTQKVGELDALVYTAEAGSAWSLIFPDYSVAVPQPDVYRIPVAYPVPRDEPELFDFLNSWVDLQKKDRTIEHLYDHWILGKRATGKEPRWSVIRNVLGWVK